MKKLIYIPVLFILFTACKKEQANDVLTGSWRLTEVHDKSTSTTAYPPAGATSSVVITFSRGQKFSGNTLRNTFSDGAYNISGDNKITFGSYSSTKVMEDSWGGSFSTVLMACGLQSIHPCTPSDFSIQGNILKINTALRYEVTLEKL
jgi:META domain